jgi:colanic acid/amylovoran biosynthesis protein
VTISPSSVLYAKHGVEWLECVSQAIQILLNKGFTVVIVPHVHRNAAASPYSCDHVISQLLMQRVNVDATKKLFVIDEDLSATDLKSIISCAKLHVGARYHSVVASLSAGVPTVCMSWHPKYMDILSLYGQSRWIWEFEAGSDELFSALDMILLELDVVRNQIQDAGKAVADQVHLNAESFLRNM